MKRIKVTESGLVMILIAAFLGNIIWSASIQSQTMELSAKVIEHHGMLSQNKDILSVLDLFMRSVVGAAGVNSIVLDKEGVTLNVGIDTKVSILNKDHIRIKKDKALILVGKGPGHKEGVAMGSMLSPIKGSTISASEKGIAMLALDTGPVKISAGKGKSEIGLIIDPQKEQIEIKKGRSVVRVGKGSFGEGVEFGEFDTGTIAITKGKGIGIKGNVPFQIEFDGDIDIKAKGNINILSEKGDVRIHGKTVRLNE